MLGHSICHQSGCHLVEPQVSQFFRLAEIGFVEVAMLGAVGIPVPITVLSFTPCCQSPLVTAKGKGLHGSIIEPGIPCGRADQDRTRRAISIIEQIELVINYLGNAMPNHNYAPLIGKKNYLQNYLNNYLLERRRSPLSISKQAIREGVMSSCFERAFLDEQRAMRKTVH